MFKLGIYSKERIDIVFTSKTTLQMLEQIEHKEDTKEHRILPTTWQKGLHAEHPTRKNVSKMTNMLPYPGGEGTLYSGLYGKALPERDAFFNLAV